MVWMLARDIFISPQDKVELALEVYGLPMILTRWFDRRRA